MLKIPLGLSDFRKLRESGAHYVDKTEFVRGVLASGAEAALFLRPRRFGKTMNLSALRWFLEKSGTDLSEAFQTLAVWQDAEARAHFQRYPVVWLTFKDLRVKTMADFERGMLELLADEFERHPELESSPQLSARARAKFQRIATGKAEFPEARTALLELSRGLHQHHGERVAILIDEYDLPIHAAIANGYSEQVIDFFRNFLSAGLKDNSHLFKGVLSGVLRIAKESLFSGLNNLSVYGVTRSEFGTSFGFTASEVESLLASVGRPDLFGAVAEWYDGYMLAGQHVYNPWSVLSFVDSEHKELRPYWRATGSEDLLRDLLLERGLGFRAEMEKLVEGAAVRVPLDESLAIRDLDRHPGALWTFLLYSGYLTAQDLEVEPSGALRANVMIPNREVRGTYVTLFTRWLEERMGGENAAQDLVRAVLAGDAPALEHHLARLVENIMSYHDAAVVHGERVFHAFLLGLLAQLEGRFDVRSDRESGFGRADIQILPRRAGEPGVVLEVKRVDGNAGESLEDALDSALAQIRSRDYAAELRARGAAPISALAVAFEGKRVGVRAG